eukprot:scaffold34689_cov289-Amphora_coffeaeformis.AAC.2
MENVVMGTISWPWLSSVQGATISMAWESVMSKSKSPEFKSGSSVRRKRSFSVWTTVGLSDRANPRSMRLLITLLSFGHLSQEFGNVFDGSRDKGIRHQECHIGLSNGLKGFVPFQTSQFALFVNARCIKQAYGSNRPVQFHKTSFRIGRCPRRLMDNGNLGLGQ